MAKNRRGKGEGSIYQRGDGYWVGSCEAGYQWSEAKGRMVRRQARVVRKHRSDVVSALDELRRQVGAGVIPDRTVTVEKYLTWWLDNVVAGAVSESTLKGKWTRASQWVIPFVGRHRLAVLRAAHVAQMMTALKAKGFSASTREAALTLLKQACEFAVTDGVLMRNPCDGIKAPNVEPKTDDTPTEDEAKALLKAAESDRLGAMAYLVLTYGLRPGEVSRLRWSDVSDEELTIRRSTTKTEAGARTIPLLDEVKAVLARHRVLQAAEKLAAPSWADDDLMFTTEKGRALPASSRLAWWHALCEAARVRRCRMHAGRHGAATLLFEQGVDIGVVAAILGHKNEAITRRIYLRIRQDIKRRALKKVV